MPPKQNYEGIKDIIFLKIFFSTMWVWHIEDMRSCMIKIKLLLYPYYNLK